MSKVSLVGVTESRVAGVDSAEELVAYAARVSNPSNQANKLTASKLLKYLVDNKHWSPLEMVSITMEINTTRTIARQVLRHRSFSFQEFSGRYSNMEALGFELTEARLQDSKNRQASIETDDKELCRLWEEKQQQVLSVVRDTYTWALNNGIAKEQARSVLPEGLTKSRMYMAGNLRSWVHYCLLRTEIGTQKEHREIATEAFELLKLEFPSISNIVLN